MGTFKYARCMSEDKNMISEEAVQAAHAAICEQNFDDCLEWRGRCVKAVEAAAPRIAEQAWDEGRNCGARFPYGKRGLGTDDNPYRSPA